MPYTPEHYYVCCDEALIDPNHGDFDTVAIWYIKDTLGNVTTINKFFTEDDDGKFKEISLKEYTVLIEPDTIDPYEEINS